MTKFCPYIVLMMLSSGCTALSPFAQAVDDIATDDCVTASIYKGAMQKDTDIKVSIDVINKDPTK